MPGRQVPPWPQSVQPVVVRSVRPSCPNPGPLLLLALLAVCGYTTTRSASTIRRDGSPQVVHTLAGTIDLIGRSSRAGGNAA